MPGPKEPPRITPDVDAAERAFTAEPTDQNERALRRALHIAGASQEEIEDTVARGKGIVPLTTPGGLPINDIPPELLEAIDRLAVQHGMTRMEAIDRLAAIGLKEIHDGAPLPPLDVPANDAPGPWARARPKP